MGLSAFLPARTQRTTVPNLPLVAGGHFEVLKGSVVVCFCLGERDVADRLQQALVVEPINQSTHSGS